MTLEYYVFKVRTVTNPLMYSYICCNEKIDGDKLVVYKTFVYVIIPQKTRDKNITL